MHLIFFVLFAERVRQNQEQPMADPLMQLAQQVKEVLPHVPLSNIRADLGKFRRSWQNKLMLEMM